MRNFDKDYIYERALNEGISDLFKGFWGWLTGKSNKHEYDITTDEYDKALHDKYVAQYSDEAIRVQQAKLDVIKQIISKSKHKEDSKSLFAKTEVAINKSQNPDSIKWITFIFSSEHLTETAGIIGYTETSTSAVEDTMDIVDIDILQVFLKNNIVTPKTIVTELKSIAKKTNNKELLFKNMDNALKKEFESYNYQLTPSKQGVILTL